MAKVSTKKTLSVEDRIVEGLTAFRDALRDGCSLEEKFTVRTVELDLDPQKYDAESVKSTRGLLNVSQSVFAQLLGTSVKTVQSWEQGKNSPSNMAARFLDEIRKNPEHWLKRLREASIERDAELCES